VIGVEWHPGQLYPRIPALREKLIKVGAKVVNHNRYMIFQMAEVAVSRQMFRQNYSSSRGCRRGRRA
jgi:hypothetical protein